MKWTSQETWSGRNVLVTGNSGFLGSAVGHVLMAAGATVHGTGCTRSATACEVAHNMRLPDDVARLVENVQPEVIFHLAAPVTPGTVPDQQLARHAIVGGTDAVATAALRAGARLVHVGTCAEYGAIPTPYSEAHRCNPSGTYGELKHQATLQIVKKTALNWTVVRPFRAIGPNDSASVVWAACHAAVRHQEFSMTDGLQVREWNHVDAIAQGIVAAGAHPAALHQIINVGGGPRMSVRDIVFKVYSLAQADVAKVRVGERPRRAHEVDALFGDHAKACSLWGEISQPPLNDTLTAMLQGQAALLGGVA